MAFKIEKRTTKELTVEAQQSEPSLQTSKVVVDLQTDTTPLMDFSKHVVDLPNDGDSENIQLQDRTVHDIAVKGPRMFDEYDPYSPISKGRCSIHLFFPEEKDNDNDSNQTALAREFIVKLSIQDNCTVFFHEHSESMSRAKHAPIIEYELDNELLGNEMLHYFIEVKKPNGKKVFYMKSRNCVKSSAAKVSNGRWTITQLSNNEQSQRIVLEDYVDVGSAKIWYIGNEDAEDIYAPYLVFDKTKNIWLFMGEDDVLEYIYLDASTTKMHFPQHNAYAQWHI